MDQEKKSVFVTGGSGGIGSAIAEKLAKIGWEVHLGYHHQVCKSEKIRAKYPTNIILHQVDICDETSVQDVQKAVKAYRQGNPIDALVNCAGVDGYGLLQDLSLSDWKHIMDTNITGTFLMTRAFLPQMIANRSGSILNLSSIWGARGASCEVAYSTSKGAVDAFTRALAQEVAYSGIRVNALAPGVVRTKMFDHLNQEDQAATLSEIPFARAAEPKEIAHYAAFILSERANYLTGQIITVAGGFVI